jgi:hypothetical protein
VEEASSSRIIVVNNLTAAADEEANTMMHNYTKIHGFAYFEIDCRNPEETQSLWKYIDENSAKLKPSISKLRGNFTIIKKPAFKKPKQRNCCLL